VSSVLRPHQHSIGYMGDGFYRENIKFKLCNLQTANSLPKQAYYGTHGASCGQNKKGK